MRSKHLFFTYYPKTIFYYYLTVIYYSYLSIAIRPQHLLVSKLNPKYYIILMVVVVVVVIVVVVIVGVIIIAIADAYLDIILDEGMLEILAICRKA
jgi:ABC-type Mn2+/Zn2+ transport system permease subunit